MCCCSCLQRLLSKPLFQVFTVIFVVFSFSGYTGTTPFFRRALKFDILDGVHTPYDRPFSEIWESALDGNWWCNAKVLLDGLIPANAILYERVLVGKAKDSDESKAYFQQTQTHMVDKIIKKHPNDADPVPGYLWFGNGNWQQILSLFVQKNPYMAMYLTAGQDGGKRFLELKAYDEKDFKKPLDTYYHNLAKLESGESNFHFINVRFDKNMNITKITYYDERTKKSVTPPEKDWDYWATGALYNVFNFGESVHAITHVFHYILTNAIYQSTKHDESLHTWAKPYMENVFVKYVEVGGSLIRPSVGFVFRLLEMLVFPLRKIIESLVPFALADHKIITADHNLGIKFREFAKEKYFTVWGQCQTADEFVNKFLLKDLIKTGGKDLAEEAGILKEFFEMVKHVAPYAKDMADAMKKDNAFAYDTANANLRHYIKHSSDTGMDIKDINAFIQLMSVTGIMHGSTISMTRLVLLPEVVRWKNIERSTWDLDDEVLTDEVHVTGAGMLEGRHVFMHESPKEMYANAFNTWHTEKIDKHLYEVMTEYDNKVNKQKEKNKEKLLSDPEHLREYGWILTDWCPDGFDGKQMTIATYM